MPNANAATRWMPAESRKALAKAKVRAKKFMFVFDPANPDISQARESAYEWHGRLWSPFLYCYAALGCRIASEVLRRGLLREVCSAFQAVAAHPEQYRPDELAKLRNLQVCVESASLSGSRGRR